MRKRTGRWVQLTFSSAEYWESDQCASCFRELGSWVLMYTEAEDGVLIARFCPECAADLREELPQGTHVLGTGP